MDFGLREERNDVNLVLPVYNTTKQQVTMRTPDLMRSVVSDDLQAKSLLSGPTVGRMAS